MGSVREDLKFLSKRFVSAGYLKSVVGHHLCGRQPVPVLSADPLKTLTEGKSCFWLPGLLDALKKCKCFLTTNRHFKLLPKKVCLVACGH